jgi:hypothetical protein
MKCEELLGVEGLVTLGDDETGATGGPSSSAVVMGGTGAIIS